MSEAESVVELGAGAAELATEEAAEAVAGTGAEEAAAEGVALRGAD